MRLNLKFILMFLCLMVFIVFIYWTRCSDISLARNLVPRIRNHQTEPTEEIDCYINQEYSISCRREGDEVYLPFSFLHKYFEVYGTIVNVDESTRFDWSHSYGKVNFPKGNYDSKGVFMYFENYNVEMRERVKCVSGMEGVPISIQWESQGYFYPTQIAQFGLSHYSKNLTDPEPRRKILEDGEKNSADWIVPKNSTITNRFDITLNTNIITFVTTNSYESTIKLSLNHVLDLVLSIDLFLKQNSSLIVTLQNRETKKTYKLNYLASDMLLSIQNENIYYGIGSNNLSWKKITRDLLVDLQKGMPSVSIEKKRKLRRTELRIIEISFFGTGSFDNLTLSTSEHLAQFYESAEWFVKHQDLTTGGWANPVKRKLGSGFAELQHGWYSAMGQGHAISLLARAYHHSKGDTRYLSAAIDGMKPFRVPSYQGGVLATFLGKYAWYEEYPTSPPSFVLNGFIYSLLGLYDLSSIAPLSYSHEAAALFNQGMTSLKKMILLFDLGSGTSYDLRHFTLGIAPNIARWDYHATHVNQLLLIITIDKDQVLSQTAERWRGYMLGKRASHN